MGASTTRKPKIQAREIQTELVLWTGPPTISERAALTTSLTGWFLAKAWSQPGIEATGTKADEAKMKGNRIGKTMTCAFSALEPESQRGGKAHRAPTEE